VQESASRIQGRQETDTVELVDDIRYYLSERFRLRFEDAGLDEMMDEDAEAVAAASLQDQKSIPPPEDEGVDVHSGLTPPGEEAGFAPDLEFLESQGIVRTLDGDVAGDEFAQDAMNYQILLGKLERLMETLGLDG
jgi:ankyrin repeat and BTB/POZ domain-containing protein 1